jgi:gliding motility-associated-like protein
LSISNDTIICHQGEVSMDVYSLTNGLPPYSYSWTFEGAGVGNGQDIDFAPTGSGQACVDVNDACGYSASECFAIEMLPAVVSTFSADTTEGCWPGSFHLSITSDPTSYTNSAWTFTDGSSYFNTNDLEVSFDNPGQYNATLTLSNLVGCEYIANMPLSLVSYAPPVAGYLAGPQPTDIYDTEIHFEDVTSGYPIQSYQWTFSELDGTLLGGSNQANPVFTFPNAFGNNYIVALEVTDIHNCSDMTTGNTVVINDIPQFCIPTGFTPNNDGLNDVLQFIGADIDETRFQFEVFNRFGEKMFESTDPNSAWTGNTANGEYYAPNGVYSWRAIVVSKSTGVKKEINGSIIIMR